LVVALYGPAYQPIEVELVGRIDSVKGGIRTIFVVVPDAPVSKVVVELFGGKKGLLDNSRNICRHRNRATVKLTGHNGKVYNTKPELKASGCKKRKKKKSKRHRRARGSLSSASRVR